jgi:hypothetical protein
VVGAEARTNNDTIEQLLTHIDGRGSHRSFNAISEIRRRLGPDTPKVLLDWFKKQKAWDIRCACDYYCFRDARQSAAAFELGLLAIRDRSKVVRYRGFMLLAFTLRKSAILALEEALQAENVTSIREDILAAIDAIASQNHNYFVDRDHSGKISYKFR